MYALFNQFEMDDIITQDHQSSEVPEEFLSPILYRSKNYFQWVVAAIIVFD